MTSHNLKMAAVQFFFGILLHKHSAVMLVIWPGTFWEITMKNWMAYVAIPTGPCQEENQGCWDYSKTCLKRPLKIDKTKVLMENGCLMKVESIAECSPLEHSAILLTCIKR